MNRYRVYIKQARPNILGALSDTSTDGNQVISNLIAVNKSYSYEFKRITPIDGGDISYTIYEYQNEHGFSVSTKTITYNLNSDDPNKKPYKYTPESGINFVRIGIRDIDAQSKKDSYMFLRSASAILVHDSGAIDEKYHLVNATLTLTDNSAGSFEFVIHKKHLYYSTKINLWTDTIYVTRTYSDGSEKICWDGRIIYEQIDSSGNRVYHAEGALSYFNDIRVLETKANYFTIPSQLTVYSFINEFVIGDFNERNAQCSRIDRSFYYSKNIQNPVNDVPDFYNCQEGSTIYIDQGSSFEWQTSYESGFTWLSNIRESFDAHFKIRYRDYDSPKNDTICRVLTGVQDFNRSLDANRYPIIYAKFGLDIFSAQKTTDINNFATRILPRGAEWEDANGNQHYIYLNYDYYINESGEKIGQYHAESLYLEDISLMKQYGVVTAIVTFENAETSAKLKSEAQKWFSDIKKELLSKNIEISLTTLFSSIVPGSSDPFADGEYLDVWTKVIAEIPELGITSDDPEEYYISSISVPIDNYLNTSVTLSSFSKNISDMAITSGDIKGYSKGIIDSSN